jgi:hypothetical protein
MLAFEACRWTTLVRSRFWAFVRFEGGLWAFAVRACAWMCGVCVCVCEYIHTWEVWHKSLRRDVVCVRACACVCV